MRLVLLTVEGKGLSSEIQKKTTSGASGSGRKRKKNAQRQNAEEQEERGGEDDTRKWREVKIILREFHLSTRRGVECGEESESEESGPAFLPSAHPLLLTLLSHPLLFLFSR